MYDSQDKMKDEFTIILTAEFSALRVRIAVLDLNWVTSIMLDQILDFIQTVRKLTEKMKVTVPLAV